MLRDLPDLEISHVCLEAGIPHICSLHCKCKSLKRMKIHQDMAVAERFKVPHILRHSQETNLRELTHGHVTDQTRKSEAFVEVDLAEINNIPLEVNINAWILDMTSHSKLVLEYSYNTRLLQFLTVSNAYS